MSSLSIPPASRLQLWPEQRRAQLALLAILALALAIRLVLWSLPEHQPANDEVEYLTVARDLLAGRGWRFYEGYPWLRAPLYPLFLAGSLALAGGDARLASLPAIALSVATVYLLFLLGQAITIFQRSIPGLRTRADLHSDPAISLRAGLLAALLSALLLTLATFANLWMAETLWNVLFALALLLLLRWWASPRLALAAAAGVVLGLATLTRSLPMLFTPAIVLWMLVRFRFQGASSTPEIEGSRAESRGAKLPIHAALFAVCFVLTLSPWTLRNWLAYSAFIPVETGLAYNMWAFNEPREELETIQAILSAIPNPGERAEYAQRRGIERLGEDPAILLRKIRPNLTALFRVKPIEDRFLRANYYSDVSLPYFVAALLADDLLYLLILLSAVWGLATMRFDGRVLLVLLWLLYVMATLALTHGEGRYRHFLYPALIPYAGAAFAGAGRGVCLRRRGLALACAAMLALVVFTSYPWAWVGANLERGWWQAVADWRLWRGDAEGALRAELRAVEVGEGSSDSWIRFGLANERLGHAEQALRAYRAALTLHSDYYPASVRLGALLRRLGRDDEAREAFRGQWVAPETITAWAWERLREPAPERLDVGDVLDTGFVSGVYAPEMYDGVSVRWTDGSAALRLAGGPPRLLALRIAAPRPPEAPPAHVELCLAPRRCLQLPGAASWRTYWLALPAHAGDWTLLLRSTTFSPAAVNGRSDDTRQLGVLVDRAVALPLR
ncbi:MAG: hypothetical protein KatS3mg057_1691 [Herpetosiphonaceae bacterium]|nr:MAG: hypothetical protein KatS3mg057_1691 [Herpetosiphonaceae bacterium]